MGRKLSPEKQAARNLERIKLIIEHNKFLKKSKYYKNNYWSLAAWDSWAAQGKAGSCSCGCGYYNSSLHNKRFSTSKGGKNTSNYHFVGLNVCYDCEILIEKEINYKFKRH